MNREGNTLAGTIAVVSGAAGAIGKAIAFELARHGSALRLLGRRRDALAPFLGSPETAGCAQLFEADLADPEQVGRAAEAILKESGRLDVLVHSAGTYARGAVRDAPVDQLDVLYKTNVRGPYLLTKLLLPRLAAHRGQIVFVNSTQGVAAAANVSQYAATQHALKAIADSLRQEVNRDGVRVLSVFLGRTASPLMKRICDSENRRYEPELLLQPGDVAASVVSALTLPRTAEVTNIHLRPLQKSY